MHPNVIALHNFVPSDDSQLNFTTGDIISVIQKDNSGWWYGEAMDGKAGWFPSNFVKNAQPSAKLGDQQVSSISTKTSFKTKSPVPYHITPTFSWTNRPSDPNSTQIITELCGEMIEDLENKDYDSVFKTAEEMILNLKALLAELPTESCKDEKSWISSLMLSLSKLLKAGFTSQIDEMKLIVVGLSDAMNDLMGNVSSDDLDLKKGYPSPQMSTVSSASLQSQSSPKSNSASPFMPALLFDRHGNVKAGTIGALLVHLKDYRRSDFSFTDTFLTTYKLFCSSMDLFEFLKRSLNIKPAAGMSKEEEKFWKESTYFRSLVMIMSITRKWIENYLLFGSADSNMIDPLTSLATKEIENMLPRSGEQLRRVLMRKIRNVKNMPIQKDCPIPILPRNLERMKFLELDPLELARQLSIMYSDAIIKINNHELLFGHEHITGGLKSMLSLSKKVSSWVTYSILLEKNTEKRALLLNHFILVADRCLSLSNFQTMNDIARGLREAPVYRLSKTWKALPAKSFRIFQCLLSQVSSKDNFSEYRAALETVKGPYVPLLTYHLGELRRIHSSYTTYNELEMINFKKMNFLSDNIHQVLSCQVQRYALTRVPAFHVYFNQCFTDDVDEDTKSKLSYSLEPHSKKSNIDTDQSALKSLQQLGMI